jgi:hypothetical protein
MPEQNSMPSNDRLALSVLLAAGADPGRLARWYADNSEHSHTRIASTINALKGPCVLRRASRPGRDDEYAQPAGGTTTMAADTVSMGR